MGSWIQSVDAQIASALSSWNFYTTILVLLVGVVVAYPVFFPSEPDTHPLLLARQSVPAPVRNKGESALYRASEIPHGYPLKSGLGVKDAAAPRWASGRDGDIRDIWREVTRAGGVGADGREIPRGLIMTILGKDVIEREIEELSKEINVIGSHLKAAKVSKVAIYLPNSIEYLLAIFACSFYGISPILLPYNLPHPKVYELLQATGADALVCAAGALPREDLAKNCKGLLQLIWVVEKTSRQMDWSGVPESAAARLEVGVWHELAEDQASKTSKDLPNNDNLQTPPEVITIWQSSAPEFKADIIPFAQSNLVAAVAGLISALPLRQRLNSADLVLPADSFSNTYVLCYTFAALFSHASVAINSVAGPGVELAAASSAVKPTVIIASAETLAKTHAKAIAGITSGLQKFGMATRSQALAAGRMPTDTLLFRLLAPSTTQNTPGELRLLLTSERLNAGTPPLTSAMLSDLRIFTKSRIAYALAHPKVAGAVAQSNVFDYRQENGSGCASFGGPVASVELKVLSTSEADVTGAEKGVVGELVVRGPSVAGDSVHTNVKCSIRADGTLALA